MNDNELERILKKTVVAWLMNYARICMEELSKTTKSLSQDSKFSGWDANPASPQLKSTALPPD